MLINRLTMRNIRTYNDDSLTPIDFPMGTVLFEGDVGSGKSTILYAIEFGLFGISEQKGGSHLLANGKSRGSVELTFSTENGRTYTVHRGLKRIKNSVTQEDCYLVSDGSKEELAPTDLKARIIGILKFNEPRHPRAESLIYRFAIFTPQERMKEIITEDTEDRLQTLRKVFGVEEYKVASDNSELVVHRIKTDVASLDGASKGLEEKEAEWESMRETARRLEASIPALEKRQADASRNLDELTAKERELAKDREKLTSISQRIPEVESGVRILEDQIKRENDLLRKDEEKLAKDKRLIEDLRGRKPPVKQSSLELKKRIDSKRMSKENLSSKEGELKQRLSDTNKLIRKGECPVCGQKIAAKTFGARSKHFNGELGKVRAQIENVGKEILDLTELQENAGKYEQAKTALEGFVAEASELEGAISDVKTRARDLATKVTEARSTLAGLKSESTKMAGVHERISRLETELKKAQDERDDASRELTEAKTKFGERKTEAERVAKDVQTMRKARDEAAHRRNYQTWLVSYFEPTVEAIERQVMVQMNLRFGQEFRRFFSVLVDDPELTVRVNENFEPVFEKQAYEQDYDSLSGGERTSVALAYRLALNEIVREVATSATGDLLILDEPTDGFSKRQLYRIRDVLRELECKQVILVSHEVELEGMADHIFKVTKVNGTSRVQQEGR